jgi:hypothetical protein
VALDLPLHRGACLCENYELRVTTRCLVDDLDLAASATFADACVREIVEAFRAKRHQVPIGAKTVGPAAGTKTLYHLGIGDDHRGATWFDPAGRVVWLCAAGFHRSGEDEDFFQQIRPQIASGTVYPAQADHRRVLAERQLRFAEVGPIDAERLVAAARQSPDHIVSGLLAHEVQVGVKVQPGSELDAIYVSFSTDVIAGSALKLNLLIRCFDPAGEMDPDYLANMPDEPAAPDELVMLIVRRAPER